MVRPDAVLYAGRLGAKITKPTYTMVGHPTMSEPSGKFGSHHETGRKILVWWMGSTFCGGGVAAVVQ